MDQLKIVAIRLENTDHGLRDQALQEEIDEILLHAKYLNEDIEDILANTQDTMKDIEENDTGKAGEITGGEFKSKFTLQLQILKYSMARHAKKVGLLRNIRVQDLELQDESEEKFVDFAELDPEIDIRNVKQPLDYPSERIEISREKASKFWKSKSSQKYMPFSFDINCFRELQELSVDICSGEMSPSKKGYEWLLYSVGLYYEAVEEYQQASKCLQMFVEAKKNENSSDVVKDAYFHLARCNNSEQTLLLAADRSKELLDIDIRISLALCHMHVDQKSWEKATERLNQLQKGKKHCRYLSLEIKTLEDIVKRNQ